MITQHINKHKWYRSIKIVYGFLGKDVPFNTHKYRDHPNASCNRDAILSALDSGHSHMSLLKQVHSDRCREIKGLDDIDYDYEGDAQMTQGKEVILAVQTADCVPVLLFEPTSGIVATVHAGWKGALGGVVLSTVKMMKGAGANVRRIDAIIGPSIRQSSYEVDRNFMSQFLLEDIGNARFFTKSKINKDKVFFDLSGYVRSLLNKACIKNIYDVEIDTLSDPRFFSYREETLAGKELKGQNISFIGLTPSLWW